MSATVANFQPLCLCKMLIIAPESARKDAEVRCQQWPVYDNASGRFKNVGTFWTNFSNKFFSKFF